MICSVVRTKESHAPSAAYWYETSAGGTGLYGSSAFESADGTGQVRLRVQMVRVKSV